MLFSPPTPKLASEPSQAVGISLFGYDERGEPAWVVQAEGGQMKKGEESTLSGVSLRFMRDGEDELAATCDTLSYSSDEATLSGNVRLTEEGGLHLVTQRADWNTTAKEIRASDVMIRVQSGSVVAPVFLYQIDERRAVMSGGIEAEFTGASPLTVTGEKAEARAGSIMIDSNVHIYSSDDTYTADHLEYSSDSDVVTLSGDVVGTFPHGQITTSLLIIDKDEISADNNVHISLKNGFFGGS